MPVISPINFEGDRSGRTSNPDTVNPCTVFGYDSWASSDLNYLMLSASEKDRSAGSDDPANFYDNTNYRTERGFKDPETPLRKVRGRSLSGYRYSELETPQSTGRSFSTSSLPIINTPAHSLPSPLDTPLATPMRNPAENPFESMTEQKCFENWNFNFDVPSADFTLSSAAYTGDHRSLRSSSTTSTCSRSGEDYSTPASSASSISLSSVKAMGVNPFYCPPPCLRARSNRSESVTSLTDSISELGQYERSPLHVDDAGVSARNRGSSVSKSRSLTPIVGLSPDNSELIFGGTLETASHSDLEIFDMPALDEEPESTSFLRRPKEVSPKQTADTSSNSSGDLDKPFKCASCDKSFRRMEHLRRHQKTHTLERPFACTVPRCGRRFSRTDNLKAHILTHTKKSGRNIYVEGLAEAEEIKPIKRRRSRKGESQTRS